MKNKILIALLILGIHFSAIGQDGDRKGNRLEHLMSKLDLSEDQVTQVTEIFENYKGKITKENRTASREAINAELAEVLNEEQLAKFEEISSKRANAGKRKRGKHHKGLANRAEKDAEVEARLLEMRAELEEEISEEDKASLTELRVSIAEAKEAFKTKKEGAQDLSKEEKKALREEFKTLHEAMRPDLKAVAEISNNYKDEIKSIFEENKEFFEDKKAAYKEERKAKREERKESGESTDQPERRKHRKHKEGKADADQDSEGGKKEGKARGRKHISKAVHFLLLDPNVSDADQSEIIKEINSISASPNPAAAMTNVNFEVKQAGMIRVEIRDETGKVYETIANENLEQGTYTRQVDTNKYLDKLYYISISDGKSIQTEKLLIQK